MSSVKAILLSEENEQKRTTAWHEIVFTLFLMYVLITLLNVYFLYKGIFMYFSWVEAYYKDSEITLPFSAWKVVLALEYPLLRFRFNNSSTPQIMQQLISSVSCLNPCQCQECMGQTCTASTNPLDTCANGCAQPNCVMQPVMLFGNPGGTFNPATLNNTNWATEPNNYFYPLIKADAPIVPGNSDDRLRPQDQTTAISVLFSGGFAQLAEEFHDWTMPDFMDYVFGSDNKPKPPCSNNYGAFVSGIGSSIFAGAMAGAPFSPGTPVGPIVGGIIGAGFGIFGNYKNISC